MSALFSPLEIVDCPIPNPPRALGDIPLLMWLDVDKLRIDTNYQRPILERGRVNIARIVTEFAWNKFSPLVVTPIVEGLYAIIDGQHRASAALLLGIKQVPCQIVAVKANEAAAIFSTINTNVTPMTPQYLYKAALAAKEEWALQIDRISRKIGFTVLMYPIPIRKQKPRQTMMVGTLRARLKFFGEDVVSLALEGILKSSKADMPGILRSLALDEAIIRIRGTPDAMSNRTSVIAALSRIDYMALTFQTRTHSTVAPTPRAASLSKPQGNAVPLRIIGADDRSKVLDFHSRRYQPSQIAAVLKLPHADVRRIIEEAKP